MQNNVEYSKKLCMSELKVSHAHFACPHYYDAGTGKLNSSFVYLLRGSVTLSTVGKQEELSAGSLFYIPEGIRYHSVWRGEPDVEFYALDIISKHPDDSDTPTYAMGHIPEMSTPQTGTLFAQIYALFATGERIEKIRALGKYYTFYADVLPFLRKESKDKHNPILHAALAFIERNSERDFEIAALAAHCCISESRLYHIFKSELGKSPIRLRNELRVENAAKELREGDASIEEIAQRCGFHSAAYFRETFRTFTGLTPSEYRKTVAH